MNKLRFGTGGIPLTTPKGGITAGIKHIHDLGLEHLELEFVQNIFVKEEQAPEVKQVAHDNDVTLSVHGSYYVNLAALDKAKWHASINRVVQAAERGEQCGALSITYHSGFLQGRSVTDSKNLVHEGTIEILKELEKRNSIKIKISPELTGKATQYGDLETLIMLAVELRDKGYENRIGFCIDFAHAYARSVGELNGYDNASRMLEMVVNSFGEEFLSDMHIHMSGIEFSDKGERNHLVYLEELSAYDDLGIHVQGIEKYWANLTENRKTKNNFDWQGVLKACSKMNVGGFVVCESPIMELDALVMKNFYRSL